MFTAIRPWRLRSSGAHCNPELARRIGETRGEEDWQDTWRRGLARHLAKRIGETLGKEDLREAWQRRMARRRRRRRMRMRRRISSLIKSRNPHLAFGEKKV